MKLLHLLLLPLLFCVACGNDDEPEPEKEGNCLTATIDGEEFEAETTTGVFTVTEIEYGDSDIVQETKVLTITGTIPSLTSETRTIALNFACSELTSDLDVVDTDEDCGVGMSYSITSFTDPNGSLIVTAASGGITVEELTDDSIRGTFSFSGEDQDGTSYSITEGFFDTSIVQ